MAKAAKVEAPAPTAPLQVTSGQSDGNLKLLHEQTRLAIISALAVNPSLSFKELKTLLNLSDGNLSVHARKLEDAKFVQCKKSFEGRMPKTVYKLTSAGRRALEAYLAQMETLIRRLRDGAAGD